MDRQENIDFCIRYLLEQDNAEARISSKLRDKKEQLRALMNIWRPQPLSDEFIAAQDAELQAQLRDKGVVRTRARVWQGDITRLEVDAIVNAANSRGLGCWHPLHACIDNAIHSAAGLQLRQECNKILQGEEIATGGAIITPAYNLPHGGAGGAAGLLLPHVPVLGSRARLPEYCFLLHLYRRVPFPQPACRRDCRRGLQGCANKGGLQCVQGY